MFFYNRVRELETLEQRWAGGRPELIALYGPRGVGKTALVRQFAQGRPHLYLLGDLHSERDQLAEVTQRLCDHTHDPLLAAQSLPSWSIALDYLFGLAQHERLLVVLDEFPSFCESTPTLPSLLQKVWDAQTASGSSRIMLILCGSDVAFMQRQMLAPRSPLSGRWTAELQLQPLEYWDTPDFFFQYTAEERILTYLMLGGMPSHLSRFSPDVFGMENLYWEVLDCRAVLFREARSVLLEQLREPRHYFSLLRAMAFGETRLSEIAEEAGLRSQVASKYLDVLQRLGLVERRVPVTEQHPERSRQGRYRITDNYMAFWFRFILPNQSYLEEERTDYVAKERILPSLSHYAGPYFAEVCRRFLERRRDSAQIPVAFDRVGAWWSNTEEVEIVAMRGDQVVLVGESKWTTQAVTIGDLNELRRKTATIGVGPEVRYALFSRSGFDPDLVKLASAEGILTYSLDDLFVPNITQPKGPQ